MCLAVVALDVHPRYAIVVAANRDEFHARPTARAHWWNDAEGRPLLAGRDLEQHGTWLGVARSGRFAFVTNVREPSRHDPHAPSRGALVPAVLRDAREACSALAAVVDASRGYNGFNIVAGEPGAAAFGSNRTAGAEPLATGIHGVSNARLDTPWPKLARAKAGMAAWIATSSDNLGPLFHVLADRAVARDADLPQTGLSVERERLLSAPFIRSADYGTRSSTVLAIARDGAVQFIERAFDAAGESEGDVEFRFTIERALVSTA